MLLIGGAVIAVVVSAILSFYASDGHWFQRSGSLIVLFSVMLEFRQLRIMDRLRLHAPHIGVGGVSFPTNNIPGQRLMLHRAAVSAIVAGTLIWGYGDIPFEHLAR